MSKDGSVMDGFRSGDSIYQGLTKLEGHSHIEIVKYLDALSVDEENALSDYRKNLPFSIHIPDVIRITNKYNSLLSELMDEFIFEKNISWKHKSTALDLQRDYISKISLFIEIVDDKKAGRLAKQDIINYRESLFKIPVNRSKIKQYRCKSIAELLGSDIPKSNLLSKRSIQSHFSCIGSFMNWMSKNQYCKPYLGTPLHGIINKVEECTHVMYAFSEDDLRLLFNNDYYFKNKHRKASQYWIPLLGLFSGAREIELCQLYVSDIKEVDGTWVIDVNGENGNKLSSRSSHRQIPIHSVLINQLKFLEYVEKLRGKEIRLFPELKESRDGYSQAFSKWFNRTYKKNMKVGQVEGENRNFKSFRHTLSNYYKQLGDVDEDCVAEIFGDDFDMKSLKDDTHGKPRTTKQRKELIERLRFNFIEFDKFNVWVNFN